MSSDNQPESQSRFLLNVDKFYEPQCISMWSFYVLPVYSGVMISRMKIFTNMYLQEKGFCTGRQCSHHSHWGWLWGRNRWRPHIRYGGETAPYLLFCLAKPLSSSHWLRRWNVGFVSLAGHLLSPSFGWCDQGTNCGLQHPRRCLETEMQHDLL